MRNWWNGHSSSSASRIGYEDLQGPLVEPFKSPGPFDTALQLSTQVVTSLNQNVKRREKKGLEALLAGISKISGSLYLLEQYVQDGRPNPSWETTIWILCAPSGTVEQFVATLKQLKSIPDTDMVEVMNTIDKLNMVFLAALQNDPVSVALYQTPSTPPAHPDLDQVYSHILSRIPKKHASRVHRALQWVAVTRRQLYLGELCDAAVLPGTWSSQDAHEMFTRQCDVVDDCLGLITISSDAKDEAARIRVAFAHNSLKSYLLSDARRPSSASRFSFTEMDAHILVGNTSLAYLESSLLNDPTENLEPGSESFPLLRYAREHWYYHLSKIHEGKGTTPVSTTEQALKLFDAMRKESMLRGIDDSKAEAIERPEELFHPVWGFPHQLYCASLWGMIEVVRMLMDRGDSPDVRGGFCGTPLQAAAYNGHTEVVDLLLEHGAHINLVSGHYGNALQAAAYRGNFSLVLRLLSRGADPNLAGGYYGYALQAAASNGHETLTQLLLEYGADVNARGGEYESSLIAAARGGHTEVATLLILNGAHTDSGEGQVNRAALNEAAALGHRDIVRLLLQRDTNPNIMDRHRKTALDVAKNREIVQMLLQNGGGPDIISDGSDGEDCETPALGLIYECKDPDCLRLPLGSRSSGPDLAHNEGRSFLWKAIDSKSVKLQRLLLQAKAELEKASETLAKGMIPDNGEHLHANDLVEYDEWCVAAPREFNPVDLFNWNFPKLDSEVQCVLLSFRHTIRHEGRSQQQSSLHRAHSRASHRSATGIFDEMDPKTLDSLARILEERDKSVLLYEIVNLLEARPRDHGLQERPETSAKDSSRKRLRREYKIGEMNLEDRLCLER